MAKNVGKTIVLLIVIIVLVLGGLLWFDYLGVVHVKSVFAPVYKLIGKTPQTSLTATQTNPLTSNLDEERLTKQREALDLFAEELDKREAAIKESENHYEQIALELSEREKNQVDREKTFEQTVNRYNDKNLNIEQIAINLNGMRPQASVDILCAMDDQTVIDVLRKVEEIAARDGSSSMGSYWLSLMPAERAAEIQRKMITKPNSLE